MTFTILLVIVLFWLSLKSEAQQPTYIYHVCSNTTTFTVNSTYQANRDTVLSWLVSNTTRGDGFYNTTAGSSPDTVYGISHCRVDINTTFCQAYINFASEDLTRRCPVEKTAIIYYGECLLRYSNRTIVSVLEDSRIGYWLDTQRNTSFIPQDGYFDQVVSAAAVISMNEILNRAENQPSEKRFAAVETRVSANQKLYILEQCSPDISDTDCRICLQRSIENLSCCVGRQGGGVLNPSCNVRYDIYPFYNQTAIAPLPPAPAPEEDTQNNSNWITILVASLSATFGVALISVSGFFIWRRRNNQENRENSQGAQLLDLVDGRIPNEHSTETFSGENMGKSQELPSIQLDILHAATNSFSHNNKLGEGGFGPVYKGTLADGKEIAVKRLSGTSGQGLVELKNEVMLIARLQHRNLVKLLGCCLEKNENLLVYEFMHNRSLDVFLFDPNLSAQLDWQKRLVIIKGIARGIMYLHEDSRLRIIHRDLKASNVLLDHKMNPKISDFGMARIFGEDRNEANTKRVVGTYGYMAPEYAMHGLFSIKSDVFSFGVLLLEIISGRKNNGFHLLLSGESLLTFAWKLWSKGAGMELIDQCLVPSSVASEVLKCIHIGLLCVQEDPSVRPTMSSVIYMLASDGTISLSRPTEPAFSVGRAIVEPSQSNSNDGACSVNEVTISNFVPR
ncbi:putative Cysteine-rich RLK 29 [Hibiscus syriacus]|uniref:non-specific serine/threonine protein kinase n=1 Tax=Hibiscus syriacus TaxID=106335 RepID=A0A6A2X652_HIBSY|nr:putative Cysteine-rich RLK 29 [Hibiscus syriacus]